jgi:hypothetical protein
MRLGPLALAYADTTADDELEAALAVDFAAGSYGLAGLPALFTDLDVTGTVRAEVGADLTASLFGGDAGLGVSLAMGFNDAGGGQGGAGGVAVSLAALDADNFFFEITDTFIDLGGLLSGPIKEIFVSVDSLLEPLRPVLDLVTSEVPVLSDISKLAGGRAITVLDVMRTMGGGDYDGAIAFIEAVDGVAGTISTLAGVSGSSKVSLGGFRAPADSAGKTAFLEATTRAAAEAAAEASAAVASGDIVAAPTDAGGGIGSSYATVTSGGLAFPIFDDPAGVLMDLVFGGNPTLVEWDMPDLEAGFTLEQSFPIRVRHRLLARLRHPRHPPGDGRRPVRRGDGRQDAQRRLSRRRRRRRPRQGGDDLHRHDRRRGRTERRGGQGGRRCGRARHAGGEPQGQQRRRQGAPRRARRQPP